MITYIRRAALATGIVLLFAAGCSGGAQSVKPFPLPTGCSYVDTSEDAAFIDQCVPTHEYGVEYLAQCSIGKMPWTPDCTPHPTTAGLFCCSYGETL